ncbi:MAG TPA: V-type ATP synthase subunit A [Deltaproteobacteria bacterium]|nr:V-type ATP synthase subunit A [Deltaproteobacteria bacterium]
MAETVETRGRIYGVSGPAVVVKGLKGARMHTICYVGSSGLLGEIIRIEDEFATVQVYEDTTGLTLGEEVVSYSEPLMVTLGPGLLSGVFDGIQRPLKRVREISGTFITKGLKLDALDKERVWEFTPLKKKGAAVRAGDVLGTVQEGHITHRIMVPPYIEGGVIKEIVSGEVSAESPVCILEDGRTIGLYQRWPARKRRPFGEALPPSEPFITGQRIFDTLFPVAEGGVAILPGGFGTGKTITEHTIARFSVSDIVIYIGCGERGNEITEVLRDFPQLKDPVTGYPLSERTVIVVNTSNMPVAAREASVFTGVTIAEYFRDMGYRVSLMADSISRWAEALREISSRLEEMPGEEGYPPYLATRLGTFFERAGKVRCLGDGDRQGSVTIIGAVSPPGGDFSEPVTQAAMRFTGALWALDTELAYKRHFPAVNWHKSYSLYYYQLRKWLEENVAPDMPDLREELMAVLQKEAELAEVVQIVGTEGLHDEDRLTLEIADIIKEAFLRQNVFNPKDAFATYTKQYWMLRAIFAYKNTATEALKRGVYLEKILSHPVRTSIMDVRNADNQQIEKEARKLIEEIEGAFTE